MSGHRHFCTYFDHRYLPRGMALHRSLRAVCPDFTLWVLALTDEAAEFLSRREWSDVRVVRLGELLRHDVELRGARDDRSLVEFYFTCSPCLPRYLFQVHGVDEVTYLDSDLYFFASPEAIFDEMQAASVAIIPHRFSPRAARTHARYGEFNVGWLTFRRDVRGIACLEWWRARCLEWCHDRLEGDRYADQKYLEQFPVAFEGIHIVGHPGANVAPWNVATHRFGLGPDGVDVDSQPLVFFHFQGLRRLSVHRWDSNLTGYGARLPWLLADRVFRPYIEALTDAEREIVAVWPGWSGAGVRRSATGWLAWRRAVTGRLSVFAARLAGNVITA